MLRVAVVAALITLTARPVAAGPSEVDAELATATAHYEALDYERAIEAATAIATRADATTAQRIDALLVTALAHLALVDPDQPGSEASLHHQDAASVAIEAILDLDRQFEVPEEYPAAARAAFLVTREAVERKRDRAARERCGSTPELTVDAPPRPRGGIPLTIRIHLGDPARCIESVRVTWGRDRVTRSSLHRLMLPARGDAVTWTVPADATTSRTGVDLAFYVEALDGDHGRLATLGSFEQPRRIAIAAGQPPPPVYRRWWFYVAAGVAVVGTALLVDQAIDAGPQRVRIEP